MNVYCMERWIRNALYVFIIHEQIDDSMHSSVSLSLFRIHASLSDVFKGICVHAYIYVCICTHQSVQSGDHMHMYDMIRTHLVLMPAPTWQLKCAGHGRNGRAK